MIKSFNLFSIFPQYNFSLDFQSRSELSARDGEVILNEEPLPDLSSIGHHSCVGRIDS